MSDRVESPVERAWREDRATVLACVARRVGDLQLAEDAVQEAFAAATRRWPVDGTPDRPGAWLMTTAWRKSLDVLRRERPVQLSAIEAASRVPQPPAGAAADDVLVLVLTCCHPALSVEARVALTLRHVAGLSSRQIAAAFLVSEATMDKRLVRARAKIKATGIRFRPPDPAHLAERLTGVRAVIYLIFTEGHLASGEGPAVREDLCSEAVWLAGQVHRLAPADPENTGLLALLLLHAARLGARHDDLGRLVPLGEQDRGRWDAEAITRARVLLGTTGGGPLGPYQVQAAIALLHASAAEIGRPDWARIADLYAVLSRLAPSPVVEINRAVAVGHAHGAAAGLAVLVPVVASGRLDTYPALHAAHADLLERSATPDGAAAAWIRAARATTNPAQQTELFRRAAAASEGRARRVGVGTG